MAGSVQRHQRRAEERAGKRLTLLKSFVLAVYDDDKHGSGLAGWISRHGEPPWWIAWLLDEYYWMEKGYLPHGQRDEHRWEYLMGLQAVSAAYEEAREAKAERDKKARGTGPPRGSTRPMMQLSGPGGK